MIRADLPGTMLEPLLPEAVLEPMLEPMLEPEPVRGRGTASPQGDLVAMEMEKSPAGVPST